jgi:hypothetical protein
VFNLKGGGGGLSLGIIFYYYSKRTCVIYIFYPKFLTKGRRCVLVERMQSPGQQVSTLVHVNKTVWVDREGAHSLI